MNEIDLEEIKKKALESVDKIASDYAAFYTLVNGYSSEELAIIVGTLIKKNSPRPRETYKNFRNVLDSFMFLKVFEFDNEKIIPEKEEPSIINEKIQEISSLLKDIKDIETCSSIAINYVLYLVFPNMGKAEGISYFKDMMKSSLLFLEKEYEEYEKKDAVHND